MAKVYDEVVGLDYSHAFVAACDKMKREKSARVPVSVQGDIRASVTVSLPVDCVPHVSKTRFVQGDACDLPQLGQFDCVLAANLLCRLPDPAAFLKRLPDIITKVGCLCAASQPPVPSLARSPCRLCFQGGVLVLVSPYSWLEEYTSRAFPHCLFVTI